MDSPTSSNNKKRGLNKLRVAAHAVGAAAVTASDAAQSRAVAAGGEVAAAALAAQLFAAAKVSGSRIEALATPPLMQARDDEGASVLHWCALRGDVASVRLCLSLGAAVDARTLPHTTAQTPLHWAAVHGHVAAAVALLDAGADVRAKDSVGATPLILATQYGHHLLFLVLLDRGAGFGTQVGDVDGAGCTAAHWAAFTGNVTALRLLARRGADLGAYDAEGYQPLHRAVRGGKLDAARFLIDEAGLDPRVRTREGPSAGAGAGSGPDDDAVDPRSVLGQAQDALRMMLGNPAYATPAGELAVRTQRDLAALVRNRADARDAADASPVGAFLARTRTVLSDTRVISRLLTPALFAFMGVCTAYLWVAKLGGVVGGLHGTLLFWGLYAATLVLYARVHGRDAGALDPYGVLGKDAWPRTEWRGVLSSLLSSSLLRRLIVRLGILGRRRGAGGGGSARSGADGAQYSARVDASSRSNDDDDDDDDDDDGDDVGDVEVGGGRGRGGIVSGGGPLLPPFSPLAASSYPSSSAAAGGNGGSSAVERLWRNVAAEIEESRALAGIDEAAEMARRALNPHASAASAAPPGSAAARVLSRVCVLCGVLTPVGLRAAHDPATGRCYARFDHHSRWAGNAVARRNHLPYVLLVLAQSLLSLSTALLAVAWAAAEAEHAAGLKLLAAAARSSFLSATRVAHATSIDDGRVQALLSAPSTVAGVLLASPLVLFGLLLHATIAFRCGVSLYGHVLNILRNVTAWEADHLGDPALSPFHRCTVDPEDPRSVALLPAFRNPFDLGSPLANAQDFVTTAIGLDTLAPDGGPSARVSLASVARREADDVDEAARFLHPRIAEGVAARLRAPMAPGTSARDLVPFEMVRKRVMVMRAALEASAAWERRAEQVKEETSFRTRVTRFLLARLPARFTSHGGHSHAGGGGGHSHGGGGGDHGGHSHGGGDHGGHSHGEPAVAPAAAPATLSAASGSAGKDAGTAAARPFSVLAVDE
jgi:uncharacterized membrane protein YgcG